MVAAASLRGFATHDPAVYAARGPAVENGRTCRDLEWCHVPSLVLPTEDTGGSPVPRRPCHVCLAMADLVQDVLAVDRLFDQVLGDVVIVVGGFEADAGVAAAEREELAGGGDFGAGA